MIKFPAIILLTGLILSPSWIVAKQADYKTVQKEANDAYRAKKYQESLDKFRYALDLSPNGWNDSHCISMIGASLRELKRYDEALEWYDLIRDLPDINDNARIRVNEYIGDLYYHKRDFEKAKDYYLLGLNNSTDFRAWATFQERLARTYLQLKDQKQAIHYFKSAMMCQEPYYWSAASSRRQLANIFMKEQKYQDVIDLYKDQDLSKYPVWERNNAPSLCGQAATKLGNLHQAIDFYQKIPEDNYNKLINLGRLHGQLKKPAEARAFFTQIGNNEKFNQRQRGEGFMLAGDCFRSEKNNIEAAGNYEKALSITTDRKLKNQLENRLKQVTPKTKSK